jgi:hypothetical protein
MNKKSISLYSFGSGVDSLSSMGWTSGINLEKDLENDYFLINSQVRENLKIFEKIKKATSNKIAKQIKFLRNEIKKLRLKNKILKASKSKAFKKMNITKTNVVNSELKSLFNFNILLNFFFIFFFHIFITPWINF